MRSYSRANQHAACRISASCRRLRCRTSSDLQWFSACDAADQNAQHLKRCFGWSPPCIGDRHVKKLDLVFRNDIYMTMAMPSDIYQESRCRRIHETHCAIRGLEGTVTEVAAKFLRRQWYWVTSSNRNSSETTTYPNRNPPFYKFAQLAGTHWQHCGTSCSCRCEPAMRIELHTWESHNPRAANFSVRRRCYIPHHAHRIAHLGIT